MLLNEPGHHEGAAIPDAGPAVAEADRSAPPTDAMLARFGDTAAGALTQVGEPAGQEVYSRFHDPDTYQVHVATSVTLEDVERVTPPEHMARLVRYAGAMEGRPMMYVNATAAGGGVAIMRNPLIPLLNQLGVPASWYALKPDDDKRFFDITKQKFHNVLQDVAKPDTRLDEDDIGLYNEVIGRNAEVLEEPLSKAGVVIIDDWQPSGLIPYIKGSPGHPGINPDVPILFRNHIHSEGGLMGTPGTPQHTTWQFIWGHNRVSEADAFVAHPRDEFVPPDVPDSKVVFMPATADLLDDLNRPLTDMEQQAGLEFINEQLALNEGQQPLDLTRPRIVLIARFDPSKGMPEGMESYAKAFERMQGLGMDVSEIPQLVVVGNGSVDDPDGAPLLKQMMDLRRERYGHIKDHIKIARVPHNDRAINALLGGATLAMQPSTKEGFESRVTDAILAGVPVIGSDRGGIPLQIEEGRSGYVIDPYDTNAWAARITSIMSDPGAYRRLRESTAEMARQESYKFTTVPNAIRWLGLSLAVMRDPDFQGNRRWAEEIPV